VGQAQFAYGRLANPEAVSLMNDLDANEFSWLINFFGDTIKLAGKKRVDAKIVKTPAPPETPVPRLFEHPDVDEAAKGRLRGQQDALNPFMLRDTIQRKTTTDLLTP
jgi:hypothetical protein